MEGVMVYIKQLIYIMLFMKVLQSIIINKKYEQYYRFVANIILIMFIIKISGEIIGGIDKAIEDFVIIRNSIEQE